MALTNYQSQVRDILNDSNSYFYTDAKLKGYINRARQICARETQCIRVLPFPTGSVASYAVTAGGSGYVTPPTVTISAPDGMGVGFVNATATAALTGSAVSSVTVVLAGTGYINAPTITFAGGGGAGAAATATLTSFVHTIANQEVYTFASLNSIVTATNPGARGIIGVQSIAVSWGSWKPMLKFCAAWTALQAYARSLNVLVQNYPLVWSQYAQGESGSIYLYPIPVQTAQMELDCFCVPIDLVDDTTVEAIPEPWTDAVCFLACYYAYLNGQRPDYAAKMLAEYKRYIREGRQAAQPTAIPDMYDTGY